MKKKRKKVLTGWTYPKWQMGYVSQEAVFIPRISPKKRFDFDVKVKITIEEG